MTVDAPSLTEQVFRIAGSRAGTMGTGFAIYRDDMYLYIVTCHHVVEQVGKEGLTVDAKPANLLYSGFDLAVLGVATSDLPVTPFLSQPVGRPGVTFRTAGFYKLTDYSVTQNLKGILREQIQVFSEDFPERTSAWHIEIQGQTRLMPGHSGAPVVNEHGIVIAVISVSQDDGTMGHAISIDALRVIWPNMPNNLFISQKDPILTQADPPLMNCAQELAAFYSLLDGRDTITRTILLRGENGCGKTQLVNKYRNLAKQYSRPNIYFDLRQQLLVDRCLERIVDKLENTHYFSDFRQSLSKEKPESLSKQKEWEVQLTRSFFIDFSKLEQKGLAFIFFDQFEKADRRFQEWLLTEFIERLEEKALIVVVAGSEGLNNIRQYEWIKCFTPKINEIEHFYSYVESLNVQVEPTIMTALHDAFKSAPKGFVDFVDSLRQQQGL